MLGTEGLDDPLVEGVTQHAGGNPFFAAELLLAAIAEGSLHPHVAGPLGAVVGAAEDRGRLRFRERSTI